MRAWPWTPSIRRRVPWTSGWWSWRAASTSRFTFDPGNDIYPVWSPDGSRIVFGSDRDGGVPHLYQKRADGVGIEEPVVKSSLNMLPHGFSPDGRFLVYRTLVNGRSQIGILRLVGERTLRLFDPSPFVQQRQPSVAGRPMADVRANESGRFEIYVQSFPAPGGGKWQISKDGGLFPRWRRDGRELFYYASDERLMAVPVRSATTLDVGAAVPLFEAHLLNGPLRLRRFGTSTTWRATASGSCSTCRSKTRPPHRSPSS